jgi:Tfp pilus assembly protein PilV
MNFDNKKRSGFTLVEIMISSFILLLVVGITMTCFITLLKQHQLLQATTDISLELQTATRKVYTTVVSSPSAPQIYTDSAATTLAPKAFIGTSTTLYTASGLSIRIAEAANHYIMVTGGTDILDAATNTLGYKKEQTTITLSNVDPQATTHQLIATGATCPSTTITSFDAAIFNPGFFSDDGDGFKIKPSDFFAKDGVVSIPQTGYGGPTTATVSSVGLKSITFTKQLSTTSGWGLPNGTLLTAPSPTMSRLTVITTATGKLRPGDLVLYPDDTNATTQATYTVLAHNIVYQKDVRCDPSSSAATDAYPFTYNTQTQELIVNLQCLPAGNRIAGRATIGTRLRILIRTPPDQNNINNI